MPVATPLPIAAPPVMQTIEQPPGFSLDQVFLAQQAIVEHCEQQMSRIAILDPPTNQNGTVLSIAEIQDWRRRFDSKYAALYYPQLLVYDPLKLNGQVVRAIPPCGHIAGTYARIDQERGPYQAPANEELNWVQAVSVDITGAVQGVLNPLGINCIRTFAGRGIRIYGARTVSSDQNWIYVNVRRLFIMLERSLEVATQWAVFEPNNAGLSQTLKLNITTFLETLWQQGAFAGSKPADAFYVKINNNMPDMVDQGQLIIEVGIAPSIPAEFVVFRIGRTLDELEITE
jgi:phage tail sheath protein FI